MRKNCSIQNIKWSSKSFLLSTSAIMVAGVFTFPDVAMAVDDFADWDNVNITKGAADVLDTGLGSTTIEQHSMRAIGEAQELHIGTMGNVTINQGSKDALFVGRVIGNHDDPTQILGQLSADGRVMIIDRNGVFFGEGSRVDAAGIAVSTGNVSDDQIMSGADKFTFENFGDGEIVLNGKINVTDAGLAAFVAPTVRNNGVINAKMGHVVLASGDKVTLDMYGDGLVEVAVEGELKQSLIENKGVIDATGGRVNISAATAKGVVDSVVNNEGLISASSVKVVGGKIILSGTVDTSASDGGEIEIKGSNKTTFTGKVIAGKNSKTEISGNELALGGTMELGEGSKVSFDPVTLDIGAAEAATLVSVINNNGVVVDVTAQDRINVNADIDSSAQTTNSTLNFKDEDANNDLRVDLNAKIKLGANQTLTGEATTVNVSSAGKIQNGVDVAKNGASVNVAAGTYNESVKVNKALNLSGANAGLAGNDAARGAESKVAPNSPGFLVTADNVTIDGFEIDGGNVGVEVQNANNATIKNNYIHGQFHPSAEGNSFGGLATGDGIYIENSNGTNVTHNKIAEYNDDGVHARLVSNINISENEINDNGNGDEGIAVAVASGTVDVLNNKITSSRRDGVQISDLNGNATVSGNNILNSQNIGISLVNVTGGNSVVDDNTILGGVVGIDVVNGNNILIGDVDAVADSGNNIDSSLTGVRIKNSNLITVQDNNLYGVVDGVSFVNGIAGNKRLFVYDNNINASATGILVQGGMSSGSILSLGAQNIGNTIVAGGDGIRVEGAITNARLRVTGSDITGGNDGIEIQEIGEDGIAAVWYNSKITGLGANGVRVNSVHAVTPGSGFSLVGNGLVEGKVNDGVFIGAVDNANIGIVDNDLIKGNRHGVNFNETVSNANILIGDDGLDKTASTIESVSPAGDGIHFDKAVSNTNINVGAGVMSFQSLAATTFFSIEAMKGITLNTGNDGIGFDMGLAHVNLVVVDSTFNSGDNGIELFGALNDTDVTVTGNTIHAVNDGIDFDNTVIGGNIRIGGLNPSEGNFITAGETGVEFGKPLLPSIIDGVTIDVYGNSIFGDINGFTMDGNVNNTHVTIAGNSDVRGQQRGISVAGGDLTNGTTFDIFDNANIKGLTRDGILIQDLVYGGASANILNTLDLTGGDDGIDFRNIESGQIVNNTITDAPKNGIHLRGAQNIDVADNRILGNSTGILLIDTDNINLSDNEIANNLLYGLHVDGTGNGSVTLVGNRFIDNPVGARFESGQIDFSDIAGQNLFKVNDLYNPAISPLVAMQFDGAPTLLSIVNETMGSTRFEGYGLRPVGSAYYVRFENGSILDTGTNLPIVIDGQFASWDGIVPDAFGGILPAPQLQAIEDRLFDADDAIINGRGQIFVGRAANDPNDPNDPNNPNNPNNPNGPNDPNALGGINNIQDFFRDFINPDSQTNRASLRVLGLPPISFANGFNPAGLNAITPAAGSPEQLAGIAPEAGGEADGNETPAAEGQEAANIEPAAGPQDQQVTCWGDALNSLENNGAVNYSFGGTFEESIAAQTACKTASQI